MVEEEIEASIWRYNILIFSRLKEIQKETAAGRPVILHVVVDTKYIETTIGPAIFETNVSYYSLLFNGDMPVEWPLFQPERGFVGTMLNAPVYFYRRQIFQFVL
jgi:hypothetical protein